MSLDDQSNGRAVARRSGVALLVFGAVMAGLVWLDPPDLYLWIKAGHVVSIIAWMSGMLYLPRLFVYHAASPAGSDQSQTFKIMEQRLYRLIMTPAMIATWIFGLWLAWRGFGFVGGWLHGKIALVFILSGVHGYYGGAVRRFAADRNTRSVKHWRLMNEVPAVLMVLIVILVIVKPF